ncbi:MAG: Enoyl-CoA hydratase [Gammaproteobacteria bacterium]|nr:Enoyl-CoA hydratase [Gammaproteobacteria bacterium]
MSAQTTASIPLQTYTERFPHLTFAQPEPGVLEIIISNPKHLNAADAHMHRDLALVWREIDLDDSVRAVLVRGDGDHFSSGGDFSLIEQMISDDATLIRVWKEASDLVYNLINCSKPVVSAIRGTAVGAGLAVALLADISIAGRDVKIIDGHTRLGVAAGDHSVIIWPLLCGLAKARYYLLTNEPLTGEEAERIGLVARCVPNDEVYPTALGVAQKLSNNSPTAIRWTKHALNNWLRMAGPSFDASLALEFLGFKLSDAKAALEAVRNRKKSTS